MANPCVTRKTADPSHSEKVIKRFISNYTDNYTEEFADIVKRILIFKSDIADRPSFGSMADSDRIKGTYEKETLQMYSEMLDDHVFGQTTIESSLDVPQPVTLSKEMFAGLRDWISSDKTDMLWVAGPYDNCYPSKMSAIAATMVKVVAEAKPMVVFHFCDLPNLRTIPKDKSVEEIGLISMVYSMIQQLIEQIQPQFDSSNDFGLNRLTPLDGNISTLDGALKLLSDLIPHCLPYIVFVVDGIERLDYREGQQGCQDVVNTLRRLTTLKPRDDEPQPIYKVLFTTSGKPGALMRTLDVKEILLQDEGSGAFDL